MSSNFQYGRRYFRYRKVLKDWFCTSMLGVDIFNFGLYLRLIQYQVNTVIILIPQHTRTFSRTRPFNIAKADDFKFPSQRA